MKARAYKRGNSKNLLKGIPNDSFVFERGAGIGWTCIAGPIPYHRAYAQAARLEQKNSTGTPLYGAVRDARLVNRIRPGDSLSGAE